MAGMLASYNWILDYVPAAADLSPSEMGAVLTGLGLELEGLEQIDGPPPGVVAARVLALREHPNADRMQIVDVDAGDGEALQICCGAFNMAVGDVVPLATIGTEMPGGWSISRAKKRGEWSNGMLCAAEEIGLDDGSSGILVLPADTPLGAALSETSGVHADWRLELNVTPNRPDCLSILGIARDLAAKLGAPLVRPPADPAAAGPPADEFASVSIAEPDLCGRFSLRVLDRVPVGAVAPPWLAHRLRVVGQRSISAVVDLSNYVMFETGQPNHTYDLDAVAGHHLGVRWAREGEQLETLDGQTRTLDPGDGVIVDGDDRPVGLAGVMGGAATEIGPATTRVALELAWWNPLAIARTATRHRLPSEASKRFEKGADPEVADFAAGRFAQLAVDLFGASVLPGTVRADGNAPERSQFAVRANRVNRLLGTDLDARRIAELVEPLGFEPMIDGDELSVSPPSWRPDATAEVDVVEEVARLIGYPQLGRSSLSSPLTGGLTASQLRRRILGDVFVANGFTEVAPMPFLGPGVLDACGVRTDAVTIANPLDTAESVLRTSLLPGLLRTVHYNATHRTEGVRLFESGRCFAAPEEGENIPREWPSLAAVAGGGHIDEIWGVAVRVLQAVGLRAPRIENAVVGGLHPGRSGRVMVADPTDADGGGSLVEVGRIGEVHPATAEAMGLSERVLYVELDPETIGTVAPGDVVGVPVSRFPSADIDLAFVVAEETPATAVSDVIAAADPMVVHVELFDVYRGESLGGGVRSLAYRLRLQAPDRTLTDEDIAAARQQVIEAVGRRSGGQLRTA